MDLIMSEILKAEGISYQSRTEENCSFNNVSLSVEKGSLIGIKSEYASLRNGFIKILAGICMPAAGSVSMHTETDTKPVTGLLLQDAGFYYDLTARDHLEMKRIAMGDGNVKRTGELLDRFGLTSYSKVRVKSFSLSMRAKLAVAIALTGDPELVLLNDPFTDMTREDTALTAQILAAEHRENGRTILYTIGPGTNPISDTDIFLNLGGSDTKNVRTADADDLSDTVIRIAAEPLDEVKKILDAMEIYSYQTKGVCLLYVYEQQERAAEIREKCIAAGIRVSECRAVRDTFSGVK